jgi:hypothetical protein
MANVYGISGVSLNFRQQVTGTGASGSLTIPATSPTPVTFTSGTGNMQVDAPFSSGPSTATGSPVTYDLTNLSGALGTVSMTSLKMFHFTNLSTTYSVNVGGGTDAMPFGLSAATVETVQPGGTIYRVAPNGGYPVTSGSTNMITIDPGSNTVQYSMTVVGV